MSVGTIITSSNGVIRSIKNALSIGASGSDNYPPALESVGAIITPALVSVGNIITPSSGVSRSNRNALSIAVSGSNNYPQHLVSVEVTKNAPSFRVSGSNNYPPAVELVGAIINTPDLVSVGVTVNSSIGVSCCNKKNTPTLVSVALLFNCCPHWCSMAMKCTPPLCCFGAHW